MHSKWALSERDLPGIEPRMGFVDSSGRSAPLEEVARGRGTFTWTIDDRDSASAAAVARMRAGREAGEAGDLERALECFREAHRLSPRWAQPVYQGAWTALLLGDDALAEALYRWTDRMVPAGYWTAKAALECLSRERRGEFPRGSYKRYVMLEFTGPAHEDSLERFVAQLPDFAPAWKDLAALRHTAEGKAIAVERGLACHPDRETRAFLLLQKALLLQGSGKQHEAVRVLESLLDPGVGTLQTRWLAQAQLMREAAQKR